MTNVIVGEALPAPPLRRGSELGNNVLAHVPDAHDFVEEPRRLLKPEAIVTTPPDLLLILPWNLADEIAEQMAYVPEWDCQLVVPIPEVALVG